MKIIKDLGKLFCILFFTVSVAYLTQGQKTYNEFHSTAQIGAELSREMIGGESEYFSIGKSIGVISGKKLLNSSFGTGFIVGHSEEETFVATNFHVLDSETCNDFSVEFRLNESESFPCRRVLVEYKDLDFVIFAIKKSTMRKDIIKFRNSSLLKNSRLFLIGVSYEDKWGARIHFGNYGNPLLITDSECLLLSEGSDITSNHVLKKGYKHCKDWMEFKIPQLPMSCDIFKGDSGSPVFNFNSKELIGILSSGVSFGDCLEEIDLKQSSHVERLKLEKFDSKFLHSYSNHFVPFSIIEERLKSESTLDIKKILDDWALMP